jgi:hypothetical protein
MLGSVHCIKADNDVGFFELFILRALLFDLGDCLEVEDSLQGQHVAVLQLGHHILHLDFKWGCHEQYLLGN